MEIVGKNRLYDRYMKITLTTKAMKRTLEGTKLIDKELKKIDEDRNKYFRLYTKGKIDFNKWNELRNEYELKYNAVSAFNPGDPSNYMTIDSRSYSIKPAMSFSCKRVPGNFAYDVTLQIKNLVLRKGLAPQDIAYIRVELGYREGSCDIYDFQVLFAYQATPLPNAVTVFKGITLSSRLAGFMDKDNVQITIDYKSALQELINKKEMSAESLVVKIGKCFLNNYSSVVSLNASGFSALQVPEEWFSDLDNGSWPWSFSYKGESPYDLFRQYMDWVSDFVIQCSGDKESGTTVRAEIKSSAITVISSYSKSTLSEIPPSSRIPYLLHCKSASLLASVLTLKILYDPTIKPGTYFYLPLQFYSADNSMSSLSKPKGLFRVITCDIDFATADKANEMVIFAVEVSAQKYLEETNQKRPITPKDNTITVGSNANYHYAEKKLTSKYWQQGLTFGVGKYVKIKKHDTLKWLAKREMGKTVIWSAKEIDEVSWLHQGINLPKSRNIYAYDFFFLIPLNTYLPSSRQGKAYVQDSPDLNVLKMMWNFAQLYEGYSVKVPDITKANILANKQSIMNILELLPSMYLYPVGYREFEDTWKVIYFCLKYGV